MCSYKLYGSESEGGGKIFVIDFWSPPVWPDKNRQMHVKVAQKWFHKKMIDFDTFTKIA